MENNQKISTGKNQFKQKNVFLIVGVIAIVALALYFMTLTKEKSLTTAKNNVQNTIQKTNIISDSMSTKKVLTNDMDYEPHERDEPYTESYIIEPVKSGTVTFKFGDKIYVDNHRSNSQEVVFYLNDPQKDVSDLRWYTINASTVIPNYQFDEYRKNFSLPSFASLDMKTKKLLLSENYSEGINYTITQNTDRAKRTICYGDFDADGKNDLAIILDNNEKQCSRLLIICTNVVTNEKYLAFSENYSDEIKIHALKKRTRIMMNRESLTSTPVDGIMMYGEDVKLAIIYNKQLQQFKTYYQE
ncbi:hypothetical protein [Pedobacter punctiformis]|uniref:VCBS repeat-containing protein n=1 Tax=Pedobacter punctiformis TaxID=3004097 RepID=A0ABT4L6N0_9SPHI|nr:hypothetical protein [Pedobacter sp. HCMS5-2]MCZ4243586.1 hypothetical protein [Pedobacter sp. HCMS5-2]